MTGAPELLIVMGATATPEQVDEVVARLEEALGFDPFSESDDVAYPVTLGDFIRFYEHAAQSHGVDSR